MSKAQFRKQLLRIKDQLIEQINEIDVTLNGYQLSKDKKRDKQQYKDYFNNHKGQTSPSFNPLQNSLLTNQLAETSQQEKDQEMPQLIHKSFKLITNDQRNFTIYDYNLERHVDIDEEAYGKFVLEEWEKLKLDTDNECWKMIQQNKRKRRNQNLYHIFPCSCSFNPFTLVRSVPFEIQVKLNFDLEQILNINMTLNSSKRSSSQYYNNIELWVQNQKDNEITQNLKEHSCLLVFFFRYFRNKVEHRKILADALNKACQIGLNLDLLNYPIIEHFVERYSNEDSWLNDIEIYSKSAIDILKNIKTLWMPKFWYMLDQIEQIIAPIVQAILSSSNQGTYLLNIYGHRARQSFFLDDVLRYFIVKHSKQVVKLKNRIRLKRNYSLIEPPSILIVDMQRDNFDAEDKLELSRYFSKKSNKDGQKHLIIIVSYEKLRCYEDLSRGTDDRLTFFNWDEEMTSQLEDYEFMKYYISLRFEDNKGPLQEVKNFYSIFWARIILKKQSKNAVEPTINNHHIQIDTEQGNYQDQQLLLESYSSSRNQNEESSQSYHSFETNE